MKPEPKIKALKNGPYIFEDIFFITDEHEEKIEIGKKASICRCGKTENKLFCDGRHIQSGFESSKRSGRKKDKKISYKGKEITVNDNRAVCSHDGTCFRELPEVFNPLEWKWIKPDNASKKDIIDIIKRCPSGALSYTLDKKEYRDYGRKSSVSFDPRGPINVEGDIKLDSDDGSEPESPEHYSLCCCGHSRNKPFCDGNHMPDML